MRSTLFFVVVLMSFGLTACMKKKTIGTPGLRADIITNPLTPTAECPNGLIATVKAYSPSATLPKQYPLGSDIYFEIQASGCSNGVKVLETNAIIGSPKTPSTTYAKVTPTSVGVGQQATFFLQVLDASGSNVVRTFRFDSDMYNVLAAATPSCEVTPSVIYHSRNRTGGATFRVTSSVDGSLTEIAGPDRAYILGNMPTLPIALQANKVSQDIPLNFQSSSGVISFKVVPSSSGSTPVTCSSTINYSACGNSIWGDFDGDGETDWLNRDCGTGNFLVSSSANNYSSLYFGSLPTSESYDQIIAGKVSGVAFENILLIKQQNVNNVLNAVFKVGISNGQAFSFVSCTVQDPTNILNDISVNDRENATELVGTKGGIRFKRTLTVSASGCAIGAPIQQASTVAISASPNPVAYNGVSILSWEATNIQGHNCSVQKCTGSNFANCGAVTNQQNIPTVSGAIITRRFVSDSITEAVKYKVACTNSISKEVVVTNQTGTGPTFNVRPGLNYAYLGSPAFVRPNYADGGSVASQAVSNLYFDWSVSNASSCSLRSTPQGGTAVSSANLSNVVTNWKAQLKDSAAYVLTCSLSGGSQTYSSTLQVNMGGSPIISNGAKSVAFPTSELNTWTATRPLIIGAAANRGKIKIYKVVVMKNVVAFDPFSAAVSSLVNASFQVSGCENAVLAPGSQCTINIKYKPAAANANDNNNNIVVVYKRFNGDIEMSGASTIVSNYEADNIAVASGTGRAPICGKGNTNCH